MTTPSEPSFDFLGGLAFEHGSPVLVTTSSLTLQLNRHEVTPQPVTLSLPEEIIVVGWPSGESLETQAATVRKTLTQAQQALQLQIVHPWTHLAELTPELLQSALAHLPESLRPAARFPGEEKNRTDQAVALLQHPERLGREPLLSELGELLFASQASLRELGLGHAKTDLMVEALLEIGVALGFYGARVVSNGLVVILMEKAGLDHLAEVRDALRQSVDPSWPLVF